MPKKKSPNRTLEYVVCTLLFVLAAASLLGVYAAHMGSGDLVFGSTIASLSLLASAVSLSLFHKEVDHCLEKK